MADKDHDKHESHGDGGGHGGGGHGGHGHGGGGHEEAHEGAPEWLISFADNVALMMGFFVILLAMNMAKPTTGGIGGEAKNGGMPEADLVDAAIAIRQAFNNPVDPDSVNPDEAELVQRVRKRLAEAAERREEGAAAEARTPGLRGQHEDVQSIRPTDYYGFGGTVRFATGETKLTDADRAELENLIPHLRGVNTRIEVRGHVSAAEAFGRPDRGMRLAFDRAFVVAQALADSGIEWDRLHVIACADNDRVTPAAHDRAGHESNQRVEIISGNREPDAKNTPAEKIPAPESPAPSHP